MKYVGRGTAVLVGILMAGCASFPAPHDRVAASEAAVRSAQELGAREVPQASSYLTLAQDELDKGKAMMRDGDNRAAAELLERSRADAEVALAMTRETKTRTAAQEAKARVQALRQGTAPAVGGGPQKPPAPPPPPNPAPPPSP